LLGHTILSGLATRASLPLLRSPSEGDVVSHGRGGANVQTYRKRPPLMAHKSTWSPQAARPGGTSRTRWRRC
jgi:hypothetical protein